MKLLVTSVISAMLLSGCAFLKFAPGDKGFAYIYENRETGKLLYCSNDQGKNVRDFKYVGTGQVPKKDIKYCALEKNKKTNLFSVFSWKGTHRTSH